MKDIDKFIIIGTGLGMQIPLIHEKIKADEYLIIEDDIELFRLSLFTTSYFELSKDAKLYFSVSDNENSFLTIITNFLGGTFLYNRYLKYSYFPAHSDNKIKQIQNALASQSFVSFAYKIQLEKILRPLEYINDDYNVLNLSRHFDDSVFSTKPVLLITAGPSLKKNIEWLKQNHHKFIIIAISAVLNTLYKNDITPDIVTHLDGFETSLVHFNNLPINDFLKNSTIILGPFSPSKVRNMFSKEQIYYYEDLGTYFTNFGTVSSRCVGSTALLLSLVLNTKELYLLGQDLAINQETGSTHSDDHKYSRNKDMSTKDNLKSTMSFKHNIFPVKGNFTDTVYTTSLFHTSIQSLYSKIPMFKHDKQTIYNLNDGANINLTTPMQIKDIDTASFLLIDKKELHNSIRELLNKYSAKKLTVNDINLIKERLAYAKEAKDSILKYINTTSYTNTNKYLYDLIGLVSTLTVKKDNNSTIDLNEVYSSYFDYSLPIVMDFFNTVGVKNSKRHIKKFDKMIQDEILEIVNIYEKSFEKFVNNRC